MEKTEFQKFLMEEFGNKDLMFRNRHRESGLRTLQVTNPGNGDKVSGDMDCSDIATVDVNAGMSKSDYQACSLVMTVCQNMIQKMISDAASKSGTDLSKALKNMDAWVQAFVDFPFPFFNFVDTQSDTYKKSAFKFSADPDIVDKIINIKGVDDLKDAVSAALHKTSGDIISYQGTERHFHYFGVIKAYFDTGIEFRVIKYEMNLKETDVKVLCTDTDVTKLDSVYDTYCFQADKDFMIKMQSKMSEQLMDYFAEQLLVFVKTFYDEQLGKVEERLAQLLRKG